MKRKFVILLTLLSISSCGDSVNSSSDKAEIHSTIAANGNNEEELKQALSEIEQEEKALRETLTSMAFDKLNHNFGKLTEDTENTVSYAVTNTGKNPLIIEKVDVSCGCTTAKKPEKPIAPGKSDIIEVIFHPKPGQLGEQKKTVTVTANTEPKIVVLNFEAFVEKQ